MAFQILQKPEFNPNLGNGFGASFASGMNIANTIMNLSQTKAKKPSYEETLQDSENHLLNRNKRIYNETLKIYSPNISAGASNTNSFTISSGAQPQPNTMFKNNTFGGDYLWASQSGNQ